MRKARGRRRRIPPFIALAFIGLCIAIAAHWLIPYNDDEFITYWPIICNAFPGNALEDMCSLHWLRLPVIDALVPLRAYLYLGSVNSLLYFPLYLLWPSPISARFFCMLLLAVQAVAFGKLFKRSPYAIYAGLVLFYPYFFQHLVDTGPIILQTTSVPLFLLLMRRWFEKREWWPPVLVALIVFAAIWSKFAYFWFLPSLALLSAIDLMEHRLALRKPHVQASLMLQTCLGGAVLIALLGILVLSKNPYPDGSRAVWDQLTSSGIRPLGELWQGFQNLRIVHAFLNPFEALQRVFMPFRPRVFMAMYDALLYVALPLILIAPAFLYRDRRPALRASAAFCAFLLMALWITTSTRTQFAHHAVLAYPFLIIAFLEILPALERHWRDRRTGNGDRAVLVVLGGLWVACNLGAFAMIPIQFVHRDSDVGRFHIYDLLNDPRLADNYVIASSTWGTYFQKALYGPPGQSVIYLHFPDHRKGGVQELYGIARRSHRKILLITMNDSKDFTLYDSMDVARHIAIGKYKLRRCEAVPVDSIWQVFLEDDGDPENPCFNRG